VKGEKNNQQKSGGLKLPFNFKD